MNTRALPMWLPLLAAAVLSACGETPEQPEPVRAVKLLTVGASGFGYAPEYAGEVRPRTESRLGFRVAGKITQRTAEVGQHVKAGQVLALLDPQDYRLAAEAGRAQVAAATTSRDLAAADLKRYQGLREQNFISGAELERREATLKSAQAQLEQANAQLASQGNQAAYTRLVADVAGVVTAVEAEPGQVVQAGTPVVRIAQDGARDVVFAVPEDKLDTLRTGQPAEVRVWAEERTLRAVVREIAASADPATRTFTAKLALPDAEAPPLGTTVYVKPQAAEVGVPVIKLPTSALRQDGKATAVWLYDAASGTVKSQPVEVATADGNEAVITRGVAPGQQVVAAGVHVLSPGQKVTVYQPKVPESRSQTARAAIENGAGKAGAQ